jgi:hypothetical protein
MTVGFADLASWEQTAYTGNKPLMLATNNDDKITKASSGWFDTYTGSTDDTDETAVSNARVRAYDRIGALTVASDTARTSPAFRLSIGSTITFDTVVIMGHNFGSVTNGGSSITADIIASDSDGAVVISDAITIASGDNSRLVFTFLYNTGGSKPSFPQRVTIPGSTRRIHLRLQNVSGSTSTKPALGEMWVGQRRQFKHNPNLPFDDKSETGLVSDFASKSGLTQRYIYHRGKALRTINKSVVDSDELASIEGAFDDSDDFTKPVVWIENPSQSSPDAYLMLVESPTLSLTLQGPTERIFTTSLIEQPPFKSSGT